MVKRICSQIIHPVALSCLVGALLGTDITWSAGSYGPGPSPSAADPSPSGQTASPLPVPASRPALTPSPRPTPSPSPAVLPSAPAPDPTIPPEAQPVYSLEVDLTNQIVTVYAYYEVVPVKVVAKRMICSAGTDDRTPVGTFILPGGKYRWLYFGKYNCWAQYAVRVDDSILFHSVIYDSSDERTLRVGTVRALGTAASHGCIRLQVPDAKWIYDNCPGGTVLTIFYGRKNEKLRISLLPDLEAPYNKPGAASAPSATPAPATPEPSPPPSPLP